MNTSKSTCQISQWRSPPVRDLAWCIGSPPLVRMPGDHNIWPDAGWYEKQLDRFCPQLQELDAEAASSLAAFAAGSDQRLGAWFEFLIAQWLEQDSRYSLLARNLAVRKALRKGGRETLGELDFIVKDHKENVTEHWEVAVKFYLGRPGARTGEQWHGPGLKDRLDLKLSRICEHQLPLVRRSRTVEVLRQQGLAVDRSRVIIKGRLFYPVSPKLAPPPGAIPGHLRGWWMRASDFPGAFAQRDWRWRRLQRGEWLAPIQEADNEAALSLGASEFAASAGISKASWPRMVAALADGVEVSRGFLVPDDWGVSAGS